MTKNVEPQTESTDDAVKQPNWFRRQISSHPRAAAFLGGAAAVVVGAGVYKAVQTSGYNDAVSDMVEHDLVVTDTPAPSED